MERKSHRLGRAIKVFSRQTNRPGAASASDPSIQQSINPIIHHTRETFMTTRGKIVLTILLLAVVGFGVYRWWDKIAPQSRPQNQSVDVAKVKQQIEEGKKAPTDIPLLIGTNAATLVERSGIPAVTATSDYKKDTKDGKLIVQFPINVWPGWAPIILANAGMEPSDQSVFAKKYGFYVRLSIVDDPVKARDLFASGQSHILWGTL